MISFVFNFGLVQATPFCLKKVVCERMTPPPPHLLPLPSSPPLPSLTPFPAPRLLSRALTHQPSHPTPGSFPFSFPHLTHPTLPPSPNLCPHPTPPPPFLSASLHIHVCFECRWHKKDFYCHKVYLFFYSYLLLQVEGICGMLTVLDCTAAV